MGISRRAATICGAACGLVASVFACNDLDGLTNDPAPDGGSETGTTIDGASPPLDSGTSGDADASLAAFCATRDATFCDDFEQGLVSGRWSETNVRGDSGIGIVTDGGASGSTASLRAFVGGDASVDGGLAAYFIKRYPGAQSKLICHAAVYVENAGATSGTSTFFIGSRHPAGWYGFGLDVGNSHSSLWVNGDLADGGRSGDEAVLGLLPIGQWLDVVLETDFVTAKIRVDGAPPVELPLPPLSRTSVEIYVGVDTDGSPAAARIDNVLCDVTP